MCKTFGVFFFINWSFFAVLSLYVVRRKSSLYIENSIPCQTDTYAEQPAVKVTSRPLPKTNKPGRQVHPVFYHLRQKSGLAAFQVAKLAGISPSTYSRYELCLRPAPQQTNRLL
jgi:hypothetical protein